MISAKSPGMVACASSDNCMACGESGAGRIHTVRVGSVCSTPSCSSAASTPSITLESSSSRQRRKSSDATYGYTSTVTSMPCARASSSRRSEATVPPAAPVALWCEICTGHPDSRPIVSASSTASSIPAASFRMWLV